MYSRYSGRYPHTFVCKEADIRKIVDVLTASIGPVEVSAEYRDGSEDVFDDVDQLLQVPNSRTRPIAGIYFNAKRPSGNIGSDPLKASVSLESAQYTDPIHFEITAPAAVRDNLKSDLGEIIENMRTDRCLLGMKPESSRQAVSVVLILAAAFCVVFGLGELTKDTPNPVEIQSVSGLVLLLLFGVALLYPFRRLVEIVFEYFLPTAAFAIGGGVDRWEAVKSRRMVWGTVILIPILISLAFTLLS